LYFIHLFLDSPLFFIRGPTPSPLSSSRSNTSDSGYGGATIPSVHTRTNSNTKSAIFGADCQNTEWTVVKSNKDKTTEKRTNLEPNHHSHHQSQSGYHRGRGGHWRGRDGRHNSRDNYYYRSKSDQAPNNKNDQQQQARMTKRQSHSEGEVQRGGSGGGRYRGAYRGGSRSRGGSNNSSYTSSHGSGGGGSGHQGSHNSKN